MKRRRPAISDEDRRLWDLVRRSATPLRPEATPEPVPPPAEAPERRAAPPAPVAPPPAPKRAPPVPTVAALDHRTRMRLSRGTVAIDARIDLHGMTQDAAYRRLHRFLETARADGARMVLVITGKGGPAEPGSHGTGRGVLRRAVPEWLRSPAYTPLVSGYHSAGPRHGGEGALYVRLRGSTRPRRTAD
ncbi:MAG: Smr/MutS family protein [Bauldia sp.]|nr:Smr/MutS family protein [Bauldia sp.]